VTKPSGLRNPPAAVRGVGAVTLVVEAVVLLLALAPLKKLGGHDAMTGVWLCLALVVVSIVLVGLLKRAWAWWAGIVVPLSLFVGGFFSHWSLIALGVLFGAVWAYVLNVRHSVLNGSQRRDHGEPEPEADGD
jgi:chromate transport protein ChrA